MTKSEGSSAAAAFPHLTVLGNVMEGPVRAEAVEILQRMGLGDRADAYPGQLPGGQWQRVAVAMKPLFLLFDEPASALAPELVGEVLRVMTDLARDGREVADRIVFMADACIVEEGTVEQVMGAPREPRTRQLLQRVLA